MAVGPEQSIYQGVGGFWGEDKSEVWITTVDAISKIDGEDPDIVLKDVRMPEGSGLKIIE